MATAPEEPTPIAPLPTPPTFADPDHFDERGDVFVSALPPFVLSANAQAARTYLNSTIAFSSAQTSQQEAANAAIYSDQAMGYRNAANAAAGTATTQAGISTGSANTATVQAQIAATQAGQASTARQGSESARDDSVAAKNASEDARDASKAYRDQAAIFASQQLIATSSTSVAPGAGAKSFATEPNRSFVVGMYLVATSASDPTTQMSGPVQSYNQATGALVLAVDMYRGAVAKADWAIGVAVSGGAASLARQVISVNTVAVPGVFYLIAAAGVTLTIPTNFTVDQAFGFGMTRGITTANINWQSNKLKGRSPGLMQLLSENDTAICVFANVTDGFVEAK